MYMRKPDDRVCDANEQAKEPSIYRIEICNESIYLNP